MKLFAARLLKKLSVDGRMDRSTLNNSQKELLSVGGLAYDNQVRSV